MRRVIQDPWEAIFGPLRRPDAASAGPTNATPAYSAALDDDAVYGVGPVTAPASSAQWMERQIAKAMDSGAFAPPGPTLTQQERIAQLKARGAASRRPTGGTGGAQVSLTPVADTEQRLAETLDHMQGRKAKLEGPDPGVTTRAAATPEFMGVIDRLLSGPDFGLGGMVQGISQGAAERARASGARNLASQLEGAGNTAAVLLPTGAALASIAVPLVLAAQSGNEQAGGGGAAINAAGAGLGVLAGAPMGTVGRAIGGLVGGGLGGGVTGMAQGLVDAKQQGDTGIAGSLGAALDGAFMGTREKEERALMAELNSPAIQAMQERRRQERHQQQMEALQLALIQSYIS
jgi:hypothetical protein